ncbi:MAG: hypothetical protein ABSD85_00270 [Acidimicrobiales bacterium]
MTTSRLPVRTGFSEAATRLEIPARELRSRAGARTGVLARLRVPVRLLAAAERPGRAATSPRGVRRRAPGPALAPGRALAPRPDGVNSLTRVG